MNPVTLLERFAVILFQGCLRPRKGSAHGIVDQMEWKLSAAIAHGVELQKATNALVKNALPTLLVHVFRLVARQ